MTVKNSLISDQAQDIFKINNGYLYCFENFYISEFDEGIKLCYENNRDYLEIVALYFKDRPFGYISNRVNSYSMDLTGCDKFLEYHKNVIAKAVVTYTENSSRFLELENYFCPIENTAEFKSLEEAKV